MLASYLLGRWLVHRVQRVHHRCCCAALAGSLCHCRHSRLLVHKAGAQLAWDYRVRSRG